MYPAITVLHLLECSCRTQSMHTELCTACRLIGGLWAAGNLPKPHSLL